MKTRTLIFALLATTISGTALYARQTAKSPASAKTRIVDTTAEQARITPLPGGGEFTTLTGNVVITSVDSTLNTQKATYNNDTQIASSPTRLRLDDKQNTLTADKGVAYYSTRDADFSGNVVINARPQQGGSANAPKGSVRRNFKDPVAITCGKVRYNWRTKKGVLTENLTIKQKNRTITATRGLYDGVAETVTLVGNIKSRNPSGEAADVPGANSRAVVSFKEGDEYMDIFSDPSVKKVHGEIVVREKANGEVEVVEEPTTPPEPVATPQASPSPAPP
ncbi:MAG: LPS export ABC transporter periplasmic protein LptC [Akkermansiaceae bacterium]|nr:LPS export ABC transporter periplasmic protein LptC [Armatimonadota bacterium]